MANKLIFFFFFLKTTLIIQDMTAVKKKRGELFETFHEFQARSSVYAAIQTWLRE